jgi:hypothetical protein
MIASKHRASSQEYIESVTYLMNSYNSSEEKAASQQLRNRVTKILDTNVRGLERCIVPAVSRSRRRALRAVLATQHKLRKKGLDGTAIGKKILRDKSLAASQPCRQLAFRLAQADEWDARVVQTSDDDDDDNNNNSQP